MPSHLKIPSSRCALIFSVVATTAMLLTSIASAQQPTQLGLNGFCPVCIVKASKWELGSPEITSVYDGITYQFPTQALLKTFEEDPAKYVPALKGDCVVCLVKGKPGVAGSVDYAALHENRLFLFPSEEVRAEFEKNSAKYENVDLAADGECIVCAVEKKKLVHGSDQFTETHDGLRYLFPSAEVAAMFRKTPQEYADAAKQLEVAATQQQVVPSQQVGFETSRAITVTGRSTCAACEFGVKPLNNPEELGLAVKTSDGGVVVVERAHELFPNFYEARYKGQDIQVQGTIVKTAGKVSWLEPSSMQTLR